MHLIHKLLSLTLGTSEAASPRTKVRGAASEPVVVAPSARRA